MNEIYIASCVVRMRPTHMATVAAMIARLPGSTVMASHPEGRLVVVLEATFSNEITALIDAMRQLSGVLSVALTYQHTEKAEAMKECIA